MGSNDPSLVDKVQTITQGFLKTPQPERLNVVYKNKTTELEEDINVRLAVYSAKSQMKQRDIINLALREFLDARDGGPPEKRPEIEILPMSEEANAIMDRVREIKHIFMTNIGKQPTCVFIRKDLVDVLKMKEGDSLLGMYVAIRTNQPGEEPIVISNRIGFTVNG